MDIIEGMGHRDRIRLARLLDVISKEEHGHLQSMASLRNKLSHTPWEELDSDEERNIQTTAEKIFNILQEKVEDRMELKEEREIDASESNFSVGFDALDPEVQVLQLEILDVLESQKGTAPLSKLSAILPFGDEKVRQRCLRMNEVGYLDLNKENESVSIRSQGIELLEEEL